MKKLLLLLLILFAGLRFFSVAFAQDRFASCDLCGYCPPEAAPQTWEACRACLYPSANPTPTIGDTLRIDPTKGIPPPPQSGRFHTMIGCIQTSLPSFQEPGAAAGFVQKVLQIIFTLAGGLAFLYIIYGAFIILTSQADPERLNHGKRLVQGAIIGLIFSLLSVFIVNLVANGVLGIPLS